MARPILFLALGALFVTGSGVASAQRRADVPAPSLADLGAWLRATPRTFRVSAVGTQRGGSTPADFDMHATVTWTASERDGHVLLDQSSFSGFEGSLAPADFGRSYILPFVDPTLDASFRVVAVRGVADTVAASRAAIAGARGVPFGNAAMFDAALTEQGLYRFVDDFFAPLLAHAARPTDGSPRALGERPTTATPFGPLDVVTRVRLEADEHAACVDGAAGGCILVRIVAEPDRERLGEILRTGDFGVPRSVRVDAMTILDESTALIGRDPARIERLANHRVVAVTGNRVGDPSSHELLRTESTFAYELVAGAAGRSRAP